MSTEHETQSLLTEERRRQILNRLHNSGVVGSADLSRHFGVSIDTIRRDLSDLAAAGSLQRVHGGALPRSRTSPSFDLRQNESPQAKETLAHAAAALVQPGQIVILDAGTTTLAIARHLRMDLAATIITNNPPAAVALASHQHLEVHLVGGRLYKSGLATVGAAAVEAFQSIHADICMLGIAGLHPEAGVTVLDLEESYVKRAMMVSAADVVAVVPAEKVDTAALHTAWGVAGLTHLITELAVGEMVLARYRSMGLKIILA